MVGQRQSWVALLVCLAVLGASEMAIRIVEPNLPDPRGWPTAETELKYHQMASMSADVQVAFTGSSSTEAAIDPALFEELSGLTAYNAAIPFATPEGLAVWVEQAVTPLLAPEILVVGVLPSTLTDTSDILVGPLIRALNPEAPEWWERSALLRRRGQLVSLDETITRMRLLSSQLWTGSGHQTGYYTESIDAAHSPSLEIAVSRERLDALTGLVQHAIAEGLQVMILFEPVLCGDPNSAACRAQSNARAIVRRDMEAIGVLVIPGPGELSPSLFADPAHLNRQGTSIFTESVAASLAGILITDVNTTRCADARSGACGLEETADRTDMTTILGEPGS